MEEFRVGGMNYQEYRNLAAKEFSLEEPQFDPSGYGECLEDLVYDKISGERLDLYRPSGKGRDLPVLVYIHGGGYVLGNKRCNARPLALLERGYAVAMIEYTKATKEPFPAQIRQVKRAIAFLKQRADEYGLDRNRIALYGESAGGNLAALAGTTGNRERFGLPDTGEYDVQAVVTDFAPINMNRISSELEQLGEKADDGLWAPLNSCGLYLGGFLKEHPELAQRANPETYITEECPPFFVQHGMSHRGLPYLQAEHFAKCLSEKIGEENVYLSLLPDVGGGDDPGYFTEKNLEKEYAFLDKVLKVGDKGVGNEQVD